METILLSYVIVMSTVVFQKISVRFKMYTRVCFFFVFFFFCMYVIRSSKIEGKETQHLLFPLNFSEEILKDTDL